MTVNEQEVDPLADKIVSLKYSVKDVNGIINMMNTPFADTSNGMG